MSSNKKNRKTKKGKEPAGCSGAIDGNIFKQEIANSEAQPEMEILRKENEKLKKENERLENENQELKVEITGSICENRQLKQEKEKLEEALKKRGNIDNRMPQSSVMEMEHDSHIENTYGSTQNVLKNSANQQPAYESTSGVGDFQMACTKLAMSPETPRVVKEDWSENGTSKEVNWSSDTEKEIDNASGWDKNYYSPKGEGAWSDDWKKKQKSGSDYKSKTTYDNKDGYNRHCVYGETRVNEYQHDNRWAHGGPNIRHDYFEEGLEANDKRRATGYKHEHNFDRRRGNYRQFSSRKREGYQQGYDKNKEQFSNKIVEKKGDLFSAPEDHSLAHCVAADLRMGSGIAVQFKQQFKNVGELAGQRKKVGQVAVLEEKGRFIYYLITKKVSTGKPRLSDLKDSLEDMKKHVEKNQVKNIAIPRLGCGLDRLDWKEVRQMLENIFADVDVTITVYNFTIEVQSLSDHQPKKSQIYISNHLMKLVDIERGTLLVVFGSECGYVDETMKELDEKFRFINDYKASSKQLGNILEIRRNEIICVLIVKKHKNDLMSYPALEGCLGKLKKIFRREEYTYMGFQAFMDGGDDLTVAKIVTLLKIAFAYIKCDTWICWPDELKSVYEDYCHSTERDAS